MPAQDARQAIPQFARQAGLQISAPTGRLRGVRTRAIKGDIDARAALRAMIAGTGLSIASDDGSMIVLKYSAAPQKISAPAPETADPEPAEADLLEGSEILASASKRSERPDRRLFRSRRSVETRRPQRCSAGGLCAARSRPERLRERRGRRCPVLVSTAASPPAPAIRTVAVYIDDTPVSGSTFFGGGQLDPGSRSQRSGSDEVLRGPQGTLLRRKQPSGAGSGS